MQEQRLKAGCGEGVPGEGGEAARTEPWEEKPVGEPRAHEGYRRSLCTLETEMPRFTANLWHIGAMQL